MAYQPITTVNIALDTLGVSRAGFGVPIFVTDEVWFKERVRTYTTLDAAKADLPLDSDAYIAVSQAFAQDVPPSQIKVGRRDADTVTFVAAAATAIGQTYSITVNDTAGVETVATFTTATGSETAAAIVADLVADLAGVTGVTVTDNTDGTFDLAKSGTEPYAVTSVSRLTYSSTSTETPANLLQAIRNEDSDFYFIAANDKSDTFVMAMAAACQAEGIQYFVSLSDVSNLGVYSDTATFTVAKLQQQGYDYTSAWYHHQAETKFPEMGYISISAPYDPGKKVWGNNIVKGSGVEVTAKNASTGLPLNGTEKNNLVNSKANFTESVGSLHGVSRYGFVSSGNNIEIDEVRNRDFLLARTEEALQNLLIRYPVLPFTDSGIALVENTLASTYDRMVSTPVQPNVLQENNPYDINLPRRKDVPFGDVSNNTLNGTVTLYLAGSILIINILGTAGYEAES